MRKNKLVHSFLSVAVTTAFLFTGYSQVLVPSVHAEQQKNDYDLELLLEIAKSNLEEQTTVQNGVIVNGFKNHKEAGVSKEAFEKFEEILSFANNEIRKGNIAIGKNILDIKADIITTNSDSACKNKNSSAKVQPAAIFDEYYVSASKASKIGKALAAGAGAAALASEFGLPLVVAAVLTALYGANELCNWNNGGYTIYYRTIPVGPVPVVGYCVPD